MSAPGPSDSPPNLAHSYGAPSTAPTSTPHPKKAPVSEQPPPLHSQLHGRETPPVLPGCCPAPPTPPEKRQGSPAHTRGHTGTPTGTRPLGPSRAPRAAQPTMAVTTSPPHAAPSPPLLSLDPQVSMSAVPTPSHLAVLPYPTLFPLVLMFPLYELISPAPNFLSLYLIFPCIWLNFPCP